MTGHAPTKRQPSELPPILHGRETSAVRSKVKRFYSSIAKVFEAWVHRRKSPHTQRAYHRIVDLGRRHVAALNGCGCSSVSGCDSGSGCIQRLRFRLRSAAGAAVRDCGSDCGQRLCSAPAAPLGAGSRTRSSH